MAAGERNRVTGVGCCVCFFSCTKPNSEAPVSAEDKSPLYWQDHRDAEHCAIVRDKPLGDNPRMIAVLESHPERERLFILIRAG